MTTQLTAAITTAGAEVTRQVAVWFDQCGRSAIGLTGQGQGPVALLYAAMRTALLDPRAGLHPTLVAATVSAREADPGAADEMRVLLRESYRPGWAPLLAALAHELTQADVQGQRQVANAVRDVEALDGVPPELKD